MTYAAPDPIPSGLRHPVVEVAGRAPLKMSDFVGDNVTFSIEQAGHRVVVAGCGSRDEDSVRFFEKDVHSGKDVRVWQITHGQDNATFSAALPGLA